MRRTLLSSVLIVLVGISCKEDDAPFCPVGYFGTNCLDSFNGPFVGVWVVSEECAENEDSYSITIVADTSDPLKFSIAGLWNENESEAVTSVSIDENDRLKFTGERQPLGTSGFNVEVFESTINESGNQIIINFSIYSATILVVNCTAICTK